MIEQQILQMHNDCATNINSSITISNKNNRIDRLKMKYIIKAKWSHGQILRLIHILLKQLSAGQLFLQPCAEGFNQGGELGKQSKEAFNMPGAAMGEW